MHYNLRNHGKCKNPSYLHKAMCIEPDHIQQKCGVAFLHLWLYILRGFDFKNVSNKSSWELNSIQKSQWMHTTISSQSGAMGLCMIQCSATFICDPTQQMVPTFTKIDFCFIAVSRRLSSTLFHTICENNNFGLLTSVLEGWKWGKNHNVLQNSIKNSIFFCGSYDTKWVPGRSFKSYTQFWWCGGNEKN